MTLKIAKVGYGYTQSLGNYETAKVYAEVEIEYEEGEDPAIVADETAHKLKTWVHIQLPEPQNVTDLRSESRTIERKLDQGIEALARLRNQWDEAIALLEKHGITITEEFPWQPKSPEPPTDSLSLAFPPREDNYESLAFPLREDEDDGYDPDEDPDEYI
ncbi:hypothetical protein [Laspinema palackyanum]|uniref:hypothetical protein n=1 Tax=Laspinema palackyanum TaxID=3231601 RepID=UPI00345CB3DE|nr:hypothetical protein [Laspinema sp. D2c]